MEHHRRGAGARAGRPGAASGAAGGASRSATWRRGRRRCRARRHRHRRARPGARRRPGAGDAMLVGGDPGIGKSTLLLQAAAAFAAARRRGVYVSGEEAPAQVRMRASRLGLADAPLGLAAETNLRDILATLEAERPELAVIDSIQTMWADHVESAPGLGRPGARRGARARRLRQAPRRRRRPGRPRHQGGPDRRPARGRAHGRHRALLRGRARPPVPHPARGQEPLRPGRRDRRLRDDRARAWPRWRTPRRCSCPSATAPASGSAVFAGIEGTRPLLVEIQALVAPRPRPAPPGAPSSAGTRAGSPCCWRCSRRAAASGFAGLDVYLNVAGGLRITEPAADLAVAAAPRLRAPGRRRCRRTRCSSARSASRARCAPPPRPRRGCARRAKLGFAVGLRARAAAGAGAARDRHSSGCGPAGIHREVLRQHRPVGPAGAWKASHSSTASCSRSSRCRRSSPTRAASCARRCRSSAGSWRRSPASPSRPWSSR